MMELVGLDNILREMVIIMVCVRETSFLTLIEGSSTKNFQAQHGVQ